MISAKVEGGHLLWIGLGVHKDDVAARAKIKVMAILAPGQAGLGVLA
jgi:hypothetical protein